MLRNRECPPPAELSTLHRAPPTLNPPTCSFVSEMGSWQRSDDAWKNRLTRKSFLVDFSILGIFTDRCYNELLFRRSKSIGMGSSGEIYMRSTISVEERTEESGRLLARFLSPKNNSIFRRPFLCKVFMEGIVSCFNF